MTRLAPLALSALVAMGCEGRPKSGEAKQADTKARSGPGIAVLDLSQGVPEEEHATLLVAPRKRSFDQLVRASEEVVKDKDIKGALVRFGGVGVGLAKADEIGALLASVRKAKKPVYCHSDGFGNATMALAARGCDKIYVSPAGQVETIGIAAQIIYMRKLLADELKLQIDMLQVGKFKGAEEPFTRDGPSDEARASLEGVLADMRASWLDSLRTSRGKAADVVEDGPYAPNRAKDLGLIDAVGYSDEALADLKKAADVKREETRFGGGNAADQPDDLGDLLRALSGGGSAAPVARVRATGSISTSGGGGLLGGRDGIVERELSKTLTKIEKDEDIKALVLRIDSPGGSALASDILWHHLMRIRKNKPIVVSVGEMAASGGYYMACTGSVIFADAASIVGSIGVVGGKVAAGPALERFGVHAETFTGKGNDPGAKARAAYLSALTPWDDASKARVLETMTAIYDLFLDRVAEGRSTNGRKMTRDQIAPSAEGRLFSGRQAKERGLVDEIGGLSEALARARQLAKVPEDARVQVLGGQRSFLEQLEDQDSPGGDEKARAALARPTPIDLLEQALPDAAVFVTSLLPLAEGERTVAAVPFAVRVE
jgi:protease IV